MSHPPVGARVELLEPRQLFSATLAGSVLTVAGTDAADVVTLAVHPQFINVLVVRDNGTEHDNSLSAVTKVQVSTGDGNDIIWFDPKLDVLAYAVSVDAGAGNDKITTTAGSDTILGGAGNDKIYANGGADMIAAGAGRDRIVAGDGGDVVNAGTGNDSVSTGSGNDVIDSGGGIDTVDAGAGDDYGCMRGGGILHAGAGDDTFVSVTGAQVFGDADKDTLTGSSGNDEIHGGSGDDLIRGLAGNDTLFGDTGNDAVFGGQDDDTLYGGSGADNLYGTDGYLDKHRDRGGDDTGYGEGDADWFETGYRWRKTDRDDAADEPPGTQNDLPQDPSYKHYDASGPTGVTGSSSTITTTRWDDYVIRTNVQRIGSFGWFSSGAYDASRAGFVPPVTSRKERAMTVTGIVELPAGWRVGETQPGPDGVVWYWLRSDKEKPAAAANYNDGSWSISNTRLPELTSDGTAPIPVTATSFGYERWILDHTASDTGSATADSVYRVPTIDGGSTIVPNTTPGLIDGADHGQWRFLGVKQGTVILSAAGTLATPAGLALNVPVLPVPVTAELRLAGHTGVYHTATTFDHLPTDGPAGVHGILLDQGALYLPADGSEPYYKP